MSDVEVIVILGPTATGKTRLAVQLAYELGGEIISADSRQVFRYMDIGTGKDLDDYTIHGKRIPCHLIDIVDPEEEYSVFHFKRDFQAALSRIVAGRKVPILCGGTGLYLESVLRDFNLPEVPPDPDLRSRLGEKSIEDLRHLLIKLNPALHNTTDLQNKKRLIRAIEIATIQAREETAPRRETDNSKIPQFFVLGVRYPRDILRQRITNRLRERLQAGLVAEVERLVARGVSHQRLEFFGLEYRFISRFLQNELNWNDMFQKLNSAIHQFSKRQMTFFRHLQRKGIEIHWIEGNDYQTAVNVLKTIGILRRI
ncbi:MAG: tRNA (adenosine(37)-N6)-dimethylallyltransferase MiaA [FCB group bacterium]|nr:tRNA (adenosine(37)-N6)-dimethylallyltransferase MiaA [FCB group bacterium]